MTAHLPSKEVEEDHRPLVIYDGACPLCRSLAVFLEHRQRNDLRILSHEEFIHTHSQPESIVKELPTADKLRVLLPSQQMIEGEKAWDYLLEHYRDLSTLNWMARKLGLRKQLPALIDKTGHHLRRFLCRACGTSR